MKLLFVGDVVSAAGCDFLAERIFSIKKKYSVDITVVNGENSAVGNGITRQSCNSLTMLGADVITTGNHAFKRRECVEMFDSVPHLIRPANYPEGVPGKGVYVIDKGRYRVAVVNLMGVVYMNPLKNPFFEMDDILSRLDTLTFSLTFTLRRLRRKRRWAITLRER